MSAATSPPGLQLRSGAVFRPLRDHGLIAFDMDSTLITIECIDELATVAGRGPEVAAITEAAMRGELASFEDSLRRRLALLAGLPVQALEQVAEERLRLQPGAKALLAACHAAGLHTMLVSGGFTFFAEKVQAELGLHEIKANQLEIVGGQLTGRLVAQAWGEVVDGEEKRRTVLAACARLGLSPQQAIAVGDGANDLPMMQAVGVSVAFHAKPRVREQADIAILEGGLDRLLEVLTP